jgi:trigger factor
MATKKTSEPKAPKPGKDIAVAKLDDGTVQITFIIPYAQVVKERAHVEKELTEGVEVPGFRKGKAPLEKALEKVPESTIIEHTLQHILPPLLGKAMTEEKLRLAIYPKFELLKANPDEDWMVRAISAELPEVKLGDYKKLIKGEAASGSRTKADS